MIVSATYVDDVDFDEMHLDDEVDGQMTLRRNRESGDVFVEMSGDGMFLLEPGDLDVVIAFVREGLRP